MWDAAIITKKLKQLIEIDVYPDEEIYLIAKPEKLIYNFNIAAEFEKEDNINFHLKDATQKS